MTRPMLTKTVYLNDIPIGQATTWTEAHAVLKAKGVRFIGKPGVAEGPTGFYVHAVLARPVSGELKHTIGRGSSNGCD